MVHSCLKDGVLCYNYAISRGFSVLWDGALVFESCAFSYTSYTLYFCLKIGIDLSWNNYTGCTRLLSCFPLISIFARRNSTSLFEAGFPFIKVSCLKKARKFSRKTIIGYFYFLYDNTEKCTGNGWRRIHRITPGSPPGKQIPLVSNCNFWRAHVCG